MDEIFKEIPVKVYYLKMHKKPDVDIDKFEIPNSTFLKLSKPISTGDYLFYYRTVGEAYHWIDRLSIEKSKLYNIINSS